MRPSGTVARAALTAVLALGALPALVGSHEPSQDRPVDAALFGSINLATARDRQGFGLILPDAAGRSAGALELRSSFAELDASEPQSPDDHGTTAMRDVPRGTTIVICGAAACIERVVNDYGPSAAGGRLIDMYRPDFFAICGCGWWSGTTEVTVKVY